MKNIFQNFYKKASAFIKKDFINQASYRLSFFLNIFSIFLSVYIFFIFSRLFEGTNSYLEEYGNDYFFFLIIGIAISDLALRISSIINTEVRNYQLTGLFEEIINLRESTTSILLFSLIYPIFYSLMRLIIYLVAAVLFFNLNLSYANLGFIIIALMLVIFSFIGISLISGAYAIAFKKGNPLSAINQISVMVLGGVFFPTTILPPWLSTISQFIPITHALEVIRYLFLPENNVNDQITYHLLIMVLFSFSLILLGLFLCGHAVKTGKKNGTLTIY